VVDFGFGRFLTSFVARFSADLSSVDFWWIFGPFLGAVFEVHF
jgi:hypothetical protein